MKLSSIEPLMQMEGIEINEFSRKLEPTTNCIIKDSVGIKESWKERTAVKTKIVKSPINTPARRTNGNLNKRLKNQGKSSKQKLFAWKPELMKIDFRKKSNIFNLFKMIRRLDSKPKKVIDVVINKNRNKQFNKQSHEVLERKFWNLSQRPIMRKMQSMKSQKNIQNSPAKTKIYKHIKIYHKAPVKYYIQPVSVPQLNPPRRVPCWKSGP